MALSKLEDELVLLWDARFREATKSLLSAAARRKSTDVFADLSPHLSALDTFWATREIAAVGLVDMYAWRWLYENPEATPAELREARPDVSVQLSDIAPNRDAMAGLLNVGLDYEPQPLSALAIPPEHRGKTRTIFTGLHHFDPEQVRSILQSAQDDRVGFAACEATHRSVPGVLTTLFIPIMVMLFMPRVTPRRWLPLLLTYLPPVLPLVIWWDGLASTLRTYRAEELRDLLSDIRDPGYRWTVEEVKVEGGPIPVLSVIGQPTS